MAASLVCGLWAISASSRPAIGSRPAATPAVQDAAAGAASTTGQLAARYHLRSRTSQFFQRGTGVKANAAGQGKDNGCRRSEVKQSGAAEPQPGQVAARYHLRNRTSRFFARGIG
jgi:hypothetical protein